MKIDKLNCCVKSILSIFHDCSHITEVRHCCSVWHELHRYRLEITKIVETTHKFLSKTLYFVRNNSKLRSTQPRSQHGDLLPFPTERDRVGRVGRVRERTLERGCGLLTFSSRRQVSREIQPKPEFQTFPRVEGMSEFQAKRFSTIDFHCFLLPIDKNHLLTIFIDFDFYVTTPGGTPTLF